MTNTSKQATLQKKCLARSRLDLSQPIPKVDLGLHGATLRSACECVQH